MEEAQKKRLLSSYSAEHGRYEWSINGPTVVMVKTHNEFKKGYGSFVRTMVIEFDGERSRTFDFVASEPGYRSTGDLQNGPGTWLSPLVGYTYGSTPIADYIGTLDNCRITLDDVNPTRVRLIGKKGSTSVRMEFDADTYIARLVEETSYGKGVSSIRRQLVRRVSSVRPFLALEADRVSSTYVNGALRNENRYHITMTTKGSALSSKVAAQSKAPAGTSLIDRQDGTIYKVREDGSLAVWITGQGSTSSFNPFGLAFVVSAAVVAWLYRKSLFSRQYR